MFLPFQSNRVYGFSTDFTACMFQVGELAVFQAVVRWVEYRRAERASLFPTLMKLVNLHLISPQDLINHVEKVGLVTETMVGVKQFLRKWPLSSTN